MITKRKKKRKAPINRILILSFFFSLYPRNSSPIIATDSLPGRERERQRNGRKNLPLKLMKIQHFLKGRLKALRPIFDVYQFLKCKTLSNIIWNTNTYMI